MKILLDTWIFENNFDISNVANNRECNLEVVKASTNLSLNIQPPCSMLNIKVAPLTESILWNKEVLQAAFLCWMDLFLAYKKFS